MSSKKASIFLVVFTLSFELLALSLFAGGPGTTAGRILSQGIGVRPMGMGEAFTAVGGDINAVYFNPAGLSSLGKREITVMYLSDIADASYSSFGYAQPLQNIGTLGFSFIYYTGGLIEINNISGTTDIKRAQEDYNVTFSYARNVFDKLSIGANVRVLGSSLIEQYSAYSVSADAGVLYVLDKLSAGLCVQNAGTPLKYKEVADPLPLKIKAGVAYKMDMDEDNAFTFGFDINKPSENTFQENFGMEYWHKKSIAVRAGYKFGYDESSLTLGGGFIWNFMQIDLCWALRGNLGNNLQCSVIIR